MSNSRRLPPLVVLTMRYPYYRKHPSDGTICPLGMFRYIGPLAKHLGCTIVDFGDVHRFLMAGGDDDADGQVDEVCYGVLRRTAATQLSLGRGVILLSPVCHRFSAYLDLLLELADSAGSSLVLVEFRQKQSMFRNPPGVENPELAVLNNIPHLIIDFEDVPLGLGRKIKYILHEFIDSASTIGRFSGFVDDGHYGCAKEEKKIRHFCHHCELTLMDCAGPVSGDCDICLETISGSYYACLLCEFFLHRSCAELPQYLQPSFHKHALRLINLGIEKKSLENFSFVYKQRNYGGFVQNRRPKVLGECLICGITETARRPSYGCLGCQDHFVHHDCMSNTPEQIKFRCHRHAFELGSFNEHALHNGKMTCYACGGKARTLSYTCPCGCYLHIQCALLLRPQVHHFRHKDHPLVLTSEPPKDGTDEYYCEICVERRHPDYWIYHCARCEYEAHPHCVIPEIPLHDFKETSWNVPDNDKYAAQFPSVDRTYLSVMRLA